MMIAFGNIAWLRKKLLIVLVFKQLFLLIFFTEKHGVINNYNIDDLPKKDSSDECNYNNDFHLEWSCDFEEVRNGAKP